MRWVALIVCLAGCYSPRLGSPSFYCHESDNPACPEGQQCISGQCYSTGGGNTVIIQDLASSSSHDDLGSSSPPDLNMCVPLGGFCQHDDSVCCSKWCQYAGSNKNTCVPHP